MIKTLLRVTQATRSKHKDIDYRAILSISVFNHSSVLCITWTFPLGNTFYSYLSFLLLQIYCSEVWGHNKCCLYYYMVQPV